MLSAQKDLHPKGKFTEHNHTSLSLTPFYFTESQNGRGWKGTLWVI